MIHSIFIREILELLIDGSENEENLHKQIFHLTERNLSYTGGGLIVTFDHDPIINKYKIDFDKILNGVKIESPTLPFGAQTSLFFEDGIISYLEIFSNSASYPLGPLEKYRLSQEWKPNGGTIIEYK